MRPENKKMQEFLRQNGINASVKFINKGSLKGCWRLYGKGQKWNKELENKLNELGFVDFDGKPLSWLSGNGGSFSVSDRL